MSPLSLAALHTAASLRLVPCIVDGPWTAQRRAIAAEARRARAAFAGWAGMDAAGRRARTLARLRALVRHAGDRVPYYRQLFRELGFDHRADFGFADYGRLPPLDRAAVRERAAELIADGFSRARLTRASTGGSTGAPTTVYCDAGDTAWRGASQEWAFGLVGYRRGARLGQLWGRALEPSMRPSLRTRLLDGLLNRQVHDCFRLDARSLAGIHAQLSAFRPDYLICYASALALLAGHLRDHGQHARYGRCGLITGAEKLEPEQRRLIESVFDGPVCESYGSRECGTMAMQRPGERDFRVAGASVLLEPYGATSAAAGREVLVTLLHSRGMPLLRYRIGDTARFGAIEAEGPSETIEEITGRVLDQIRLPGGGIVHGTEFPHFFKDFDILEFQVVQEPSGAVAVSLVGGAELRRAHLARIEQVLRRNLVDLPLSVTIVPAIERTAAGKRRPVICKMRAGA